MTKIDRRQFLARSKRASVAAAAGASLFTVPKPVRGLSANEKIVLGMVGILGAAISLVGGRILGNGYLIIPCLRVLKEKS